MKLHILTDEMKGEGPGNLPECLPAEKPEEPDSSDELDPHPIEGLLHLLRQLWEREKEGRRVMDVEVMNILEQTVPRREEEDSTGHGGEE